MPYIKKCLYGEGDVRSENLVSFAFKGATEWAKESLKDLPEEIHFLAIVFNCVGVLMAYPLVFPSYLILGPILFKEIKEKGFDPDKDLEGNLR